MIDWIRIDLPDNDLQRDLFQQSEKVYYALFNQEYTERWEEFYTYIKDTACRRSKALGGYPVDYFEDFYYVGIIDEIVCGMMFFTGYPNSHGFVAYMGVVRELDDTQIDPKARRELVKKMPGVIATNLGNLNCRYYLFELEKVKPEDLGRRRRDVETQRDRNIADRIAITNGFQRKGAKKMGWLTYRQPKLSWDREDQEIPMHLMYAPTSRFRQVPNELTRDEVKKIVEFVYMRFYKDGFEQTTRDRIMLLKWHRYLKRLMTDAIDGLPDIIRLLKIDLRKSRMRVFISYPNRRRRIARMAQEYLEALGFTTFYWGRDLRKLVGRKLAPALNAELKSSRAVIFILTAESSHSKGQCDEVAWFRKHGRHQKIVGIPLASAAFSPYLIRHWLGDDIVFLKVNPNDWNKLCNAIQEIGDRLMQIVS
jgi:TIR domain-containing protein